jgi:redox-sensing transcriptional repressor
MDTLMRGTIQQIFNVNNLTVLPPPSIFDSMPLEEGKVGASGEPAAHLPTPVLKRLPRYLTRAQELRASGCDWVSSYDLADNLGLTSSTVRQDLSHLDLVGVSKRGYATSQLEKTLRVLLGADLVQRVIIVGAGYLGCALALHGELHSHKFEPCGIFDCNPEVINTPVGELTVQPMTELAAVVRAKKVRLGVIAVPAATAQEVTDKLVSAGIRGVLNLTYTHINTPDDVAVVDARILASLQELAYVVRAEGPSKDFAAFEP